MKPVHAVFDEYWGRLNECVGLGFAELTGDLELDLLHLGISLPRLDGTSAYYTAFELNDKGCVIYCTMVGEGTVRHYAISTAGGTYSTLTRNFPYFDACFPANYAYLIGGQQVAAMECKTLPVAETIAALARGKEAFGQ